jgi:hypothetical protein
MTTVKKDPDYDPVSAHVALIKRAGRRFVKKMGRQPKELVMSLSLHMLMEDALRRDTDGLWTFCGKQIKINVNYRAYRFRWR